VSRRRIDLTGIDWHEEICQRLRIERYNSGSSL
jgi:hypothetical protein